MDRRPEHDLDARVRVTRRIDERPRAKVDARDVWLPRRLHRQCGLCGNRALQSECTCLNGSDVVRRSHAARDVPERHGLGARSCRAAHVDDDDRPGHRCAVGRHALGELRLGSGDLFAERAELRERCPPGLPGQSLRLGDERVVLPAEPRDLSLERLTRRGYRGDCHLDAKLPPASRACKVRCDRAHAAGVASTTPAAWRLLSRSR